MVNFIDDTYKRVAKIIEVNKMNIRSFEEKINVSNNSIGTAIRRKASFKSSVLNKILIAFPDIDPTWLLTGRGQMFLEGEVVLREPEITYDLKDMRAQIKLRVAEELLNDQSLIEELASHVSRILNK